MQPDPRAHIQISATECRLNMSAGAALTNRSVSAGHTLLPISLVLGEKKKSGNNRTNWIKRGRKLVSACRLILSVEGPGDGLYLCNQFFGACRNKCGLTLMMRTKGEHMPVLKWQLAPQTDLNNPRRERYSNTEQGLSLVSAALWQQISPGVHSDLITKASWTFIAQVMWATSRRAPISCLPGEAVARAHVPPLFKYFSLYTIFLQYAQWCGIYFPHFPTIFPPANPAVLRWTTFTYVRKSCRQSTRHNLVA